MRQWIGAAMLAVLALSAPAGAQSSTTQSGHWVPVWATSPRGMPDAETLRKAFPGLKLPITTVQGTVRHRLRLAKGGQALRLTLSNPYGTAVRVGAVSVAPATGAGLDAAPGTLQTVSFGGQRAITLPAHAPMLSDPVSLEIPDGGEVLVSLHLIDGVRALGPIGGPPEDGAGIIRGRDETQAERFAATYYLSMPCLLSRVDAVSPPTRGVVAAFGDSITDGMAATHGERGWPGALARRLAPRGFSVVNAGIGANRLLQPGFDGQPAALARLDSDVLALPGLSHIVMLIGINDIGRNGATVVPGEGPPIGAEEIIAAYRQIVERAHLQGVKMVGATILPFEGSDYYTAAKEKIRLAVNDWIRTGGAFDRVLDFDAFLRDPAAPGRLRREFDSGDHLHPSQVGQKAMGEMIPLDLFD
jgi:lysophospholipase L1-like esterase